MTTIKTTIKKKLGKITLPKGVRLLLDNSHHLLFIDTPSSVVNYVNISIISATLKEILSNYALEHNLTCFSLTSFIKISCNEKSNFTTEYTFYEEVEEKEITITSYEQGCNVLKDIFTPIK